MPWIAKPGECAVCGKPIILRTARQKYCESCSILVRNRRARDHQREKAKARKEAICRGTDPDRYKGLDHECRVKRRCVYGSADSCMYMSVEGHSRLLAGYPIRGGKCGAYRTGKRRSMKPKTPVAGPVLSSGKISEV